MTHVVTEPCIGCRNTVCVTVCPVNCFHLGEKQLFIDPDECIDCGACVTECPTDAIYPAGRVPAKWKDYIRINREQSRSLPLITEQQEPLG